MKKEWFSSHELIKIAGLPNTVQGINQKARRENWIMRKKSGVQGKAVEYHIDNFPEEIQKQLYMEEKQIKYDATGRELQLLWMDIYQQLTEEERHFIINWVLRNGISSMIKRLKS